MPGSPAAWPHHWVRACTPGSVVLRIANTKHGVEVDALNTATQRVERWQAQQVQWWPCRYLWRPGWCKTRPTFCARPPPGGLRALAGGQHHIRQRPARPPRCAPQLGQRVVRRALDSRARRLNGHRQGWSAPWWLGYVDATHQALQAVARRHGADPLPGAGRWCRPAGGGAMGWACAGRRLLQATPWAAWRDQILAELVAGAPGSGGQNHPHRHHPLWPRHGHSGAQY
jgi:hypothetical protein